MVLLYVALDFIDNKIDDRHHHMNFIFERILYVNVEILFIYKFEQ